MNEAKVELAVGAFLLIGICCMGYLCVSLGKLELVDGDYYRISARFDSVSGLKAGARVEVAGVEIGKVNDIGLDPKSGDQAMVSLKIKKSVKVADDVIASVRTSGIIGDKFIVMAKNTPTKRFTHWSRDELAGFP